MGTNQLDPTNQINNPPVNETLQNQSTATENTTEADLTLWNSITTDNVEDACLTQAKNFAGAQAFAVKDCKCSETKTDSRKTYSCTIKTLDVTTEYFANIDCFLQDKTCMIQTNYGSETITFEQLSQLQNQ